MMVVGRYFLSEIAILSDGVSSLSCSFSSSLYKECTEDK